MIDAASRRRNYLESESTIGGLSFNDSIDSTGSLERVSKLIKHAAYLNLVNSRDGKYYGKDKIVAPHAYGVSWLCNEPMSIIYPFCFIIMTFFAA